MSSLCRVWPPAGTSRKLQQRPGWSPRIFKIHEITTKQAPAAGAGVSAPCALQQDSPSCAHLRCQRSPSARCSCLVAAGAQTPSKTANLDPTKQQPHEQQVQGQSHLIWSRQDGPCYMWKAGVNIMCPIRSHAGHPTPPNPQSSPQATSLIGQP